jgi:hypothetical protein
VLAALALTAYSAVESASWITPTPSSRHQVPPLVSQDAPCLVFWARQARTGKVGKIESSLVLAGQI